MVRSSGRASGRSSSARIWRRCCSGVARMTIAFRGAMKAVVPDARLVHHRRQPAVGERGHAVSNARSTRTWRVASSPSRRGWTPVSRRASLTMRSGARRTASSAARAPMEWPMATIGPSFSASAARAMPAIESCCEKSATATSAWAESASTCAAQTLASQRRPGRRTICKADTAPVAKGFPVLMRESRKVKQMVCFELLMNFLHTWPPSTGCPARCGSTFLAFMPSSPSRSAAVSSLRPPISTCRRRRSATACASSRRISASGCLSRTTREVSLTPAGLELLPKVKDMIEEPLGVPRRACASTGASARNDSAIGCLPTIAAGHLPRALRKFRSAHPDVVVRVHDNSATEIADLVNAGTIEFGITLVAAHRWDFDIETADPGALRPRLPRGPSASQRKSAASWSDLQDVPLIRISPHTGNRMIIDDALGSRRESLSWRYEVQHVNTALALVQAGLGMTVIPRLAFDIAGTDRPPRGAAAQSGRQPPDRHRVPAQRAVAPRRPWRLTRTWRRKRVQRAVRVSTCQFRSVRAAPPCREGQVGVRLH